MPLTFPKRLYFKWIVDAGVLPAYHKLISTPEPTPELTAVSRELSYQLKRYDPSLYELN